MLRKIIPVKLPFTKVIEDFSWHMSNNNQYAHLMYGNSTVRFTVSLDTAKANLACKNTNMQPESDRARMHNIHRIEKRETDTDTDTYTVQMPIVPNTARITGSSAHAHMMDQSNCLLIQHVTCITVSYFMS